MFYRIKEGKLYDWADYKYDDDCLETDIITKKELDNDKALVIVDGLELVLNPDYEAEQQQKRLDDFNANFFETSIGFVRRKVYIKGTDETGDFLKDFLAQLLIAFGVLGQDIQAIIYDKPPMTEDVKDWKQYEKSIVWTKAVQQQFLTECSAQSRIDFFGA